MEISKEVLEDIISLVSTNMTGEVECNNEIVKSLLGFGAGILELNERHCGDKLYYTTVGFGGVRFCTSSIRKLKFEKESEGKL